MNNQDILKRNVIYFAQINVLHTLNTSQFKKLLLNIEYFSCSRRQIKYFLLVKLNEPNLA